MILSFGGGSASEPCTSSLGTICCFSESEGSTEGTSVVSEEGVYYSPYNRGATAEGKFRPYQGADLGMYKSTAQGLSTAFA